VATLWKPYWLELSISRQLIAKMGGELQVDSLAGAQRSGLRPGSEATYRFQGPSEIWRERIGVEPINGLNNRSMVLKTMPTTG
jgi:hypothetical protein